MDASAAWENPQIQSIQQILGLEDDKDYESLAGLRYGKLLIMADQDHDGSHIIGLLINVFYRYWPALLKLNFLQRFITPIVTASNKKKHELFFTMVDYDKWQTEVGDKAKGYQIKYFKGISTLGSEGGEYFLHMDKHVKNFVWFNDRDGEAIEVAFSKKKKKKKERRHMLLQQPQARTYIDIEDKDSSWLRYLDFFNEDFRQYWLHTIQRSIPSVVDGLKPSQRKVLLYVLENPERHEIDKMSGCVAKRTEYHHSLDSLETAIIGMASNFVGSNNVNLLEPEGHCGSRRLGLDKHPASRYIPIVLAVITRFLFHEADDVLLRYLSESGKSVEPAFFYPIIPMALVNGSEGIAVGCRTFIPNYNPLDVIDNILRLLNGEELVPLDPWYRGFKGKIKKSNDNDNGFITEGCVEEYEDGIKITELPVRRWTLDYEDKVLKQTLQLGKDYKAYKASTTDVNFDITMSKEQMETARQGKGGYLNKFKLASALSTGTSNMHLLLQNGEVKKFETPEEILQCFYQLRLKLYEERRTYMLQKLKKEILQLENQLRYIDLVMKNEIKLFPPKSINESCAELKTLGFLTIQSIELEASKVGEDVETEIKEKGNNQQEEETVPGSTEFMYLFTISIQFADDYIRKFNQEKDAKHEEFVMLEATSSEDLWRTDLEALKSQLSIDKTYQRAIQ